MTSKAKISSQHSQATAAPAAAPDAGARDEAKDAGTGPEQNRVTLTSAEYALLRSSHTILSRFMQSVADQSAQRWLSSTDDLDCKVKSADFMEALSIESLIKRIDQGREDRRAEHHGLGPNEVEVALNALVHSLCAGDAIPRVLDPCAFADTEPANMSALLGLEGDTDGDGSDRGGFVNVSEDTLRDWLVDGPLTCTECGAETAYKRLSSRAVQLPVTEKGSGRVSSVACNVLSCTSCSHEEEFPQAEGAVLRERGRLIATRLLTSANVDRRDLYEYMGQTNFLLDCAGDVMAEMLSELAETVKAGDMPEGSLPKGTVIDPRSDLMILDIESDWMCQAFDLSENLGSIRHVGGLIYRVANADEVPANPFDEEMMADTAPIHRGTAPGQVPVH